MAQDDIIEIDWSDREEISLAETKAVSGKTVKKFLLRKGAKFPEGADFTEIQLDMSLDVEGQ